MGDSQQSRMEVKYRNADRVRGLSLSPQVRALAEPKMQAASSLSEGYHCIDVPLVRPAVSSVLLLLNKKIHHADQSEETAGATGLTGETKTTPSTQGAKTEKSIAKFCINFTFYRRKCSELR